jgi:hypothetical protein
MDEHTVGMAAALQRGEQEREQRRRRTNRAALWLSGALALFLVFLGMYVVPWLIATDKAQRAARAQARAAAEAKDEAERAYYAKYDWERIPQPATFEEVTEFATSFLVRLGYTLQGELVYTEWTTNGAYKQYHYYALIDPAWPPIRLRCGVQRNYRDEALTCHIFPRGE